MAASGAAALKEPAAGPDFLEGYLSEPAYAARRGVSLRTCQRDRQLRQSPPYVQIGRRIFYRVDAVRDWLLGRERSAERKPSAPRSARSDARSSRGLAPG
ncbi:MAG: hypothetical protein FJ271_30510 [Planctomycetes bacterium]|nr:hypothetical protein [Planctomycetota bacterium]